MANRFLKHIPSGLVYVYQAHWASDPNLVEVADLEGNPLPEVDDVPPEPPVKKPRKTAALKADPLADIDAALSQDASRGLK